MATSAPGPLTINFSKETSESLLAYFEERVDMNPEVVTRFVEDVVSRQLLKIRIDNIRERFADLSHEQIDNLVEEAIAWARSPEGRACE